MLIDMYLTPYFPEYEDQFDKSIVIMIDVLRASSTVCAALYNNAKEVIAEETQEKAINIYSKLSKESRFLGGEKNSVKIDGFDAGNSPFEYTQDRISGKTVIITTTNGTKIFHKAKKSFYKIVGCFVNFQATINYVMEIVSMATEEINSITILCAGTNGRMSYEDTLCGGAFVDELSKLIDNNTLTDTSDAARNLFNFSNNDLVNFLKNKYHAKNLISLGFEKDVNLCLEFNKYPVVPLITGNSIKNVL